MTAVARPPVAPPDPWAFPTPAAEHELDNGMRLLAFDVPGQYVISVRTVFPLPLTAEPRDHEGIATIMARLLDEGTAEHSPEEFAELLERKGIALGAGMSDGGLSVDLDVPKRNLGAALELLCEALAEPAFPDSEVHRVLKSRLAEIEQERAMAPHRAAREFIATFFDSDERASRPSGGTPQTVSAITRDDLVHFHAHHVGPRGATVVVAGDLSDLDVTRLAGQALGIWQGGPTALAEPPVTPAARATDATRVVLVDRPGSVQSEFSIGCAGPDRRVEGGWAAYPVLGFVIGGSPNARIDAILREEKGFTYGIRSGFRPRQCGGLFQTSGSMRADATGESLSLLLGILDNARDGFTAEEVASGVDFISKTAPGRYATADAIADEAASLALDRLPPDFTTRTLQDMRGLTAERLVEAYRQWAGGGWTVIIVGDASLYADQVQEVARGPVSVVPA